MFITPLCQLGLHYQAASKAAAAAAAAATLPPLHLFYKLFLQFPPPKLPHPSHFLLVAVERIILPFAFALAVEIRLAFKMFIPFSSHVSFRFGLAFCFLVVAFSFEPWCLADVSLFRVSLFSLFLGLIYNQGWFSCRNSITSCPWRERIPCILNPLGPVCKSNSTSFSDSILLKPAKSTTSCSNSISSSSSGTSLSLAHTSLISRAACPLPRTRHNLSPT